MNSNKINAILKKVFWKINPDRELENIEKTLNDFMEKIENRIKKLKINAEIFVGGSFAKKTMIKKKEYDIDIFLRFDRQKAKPLAASSKLGQSEKYENISELTEKILSEIKKRKIHGSRDYFEVKTRGNLFFEIIPVLKITNPREAENVTDLSYSHVNYIRRKIKNPKILEEIKLAKAFCYANRCYGAESYISGFSGYALELLIYHYGSFLKFIKEMSKTNDKIIIDIEKHFKNKQEILMNINEAKLKSPIILIDPTYKNRNALAALSYETFEKFKKTCKDFLRNPSEKFFESKILDVKKEKEKARKSKLDFIALNIRTKKQEGDVAGTKLLKFYNHLSEDIERYFNIKNKGFIYDGGKIGRCFFSGKSKRELTLTGPKVSDEENIKAFKKVHKNIIIKSGRIYAREKIKFKLRGFLKSWERKNKNKIREMSISELKVV